MLQEVEAAIYLSSVRGCSQNENYRSYHTFNYDQYFNEFRKGIGSLKVVNDETLRGGSSSTHTLEYPARIFILPIVGAIQFKTGENETTVDVGQVATFHLAKGESYQLCNSYEAELVNYLHFIFADDGSRSKGSFDFDLNETKGNLIQLSDNSLPNSSSHQILIGKYDGRQEGGFSLSSEEQAFLFIIEGAFEVQNRLLHARDGLSIGKTDWIEFEALSNEAIILVFKIHSRQIL